MVALVSFVSGVWWRIEGMSRKNTDDLSAHKLSVAENYVTKTGMRESTEQIMGAIGGLRDSLNHISERMDRLMDQRPSGRRATN